MQLFWNFGKKKFIMFPMLSIIAYDLLTPPISFIASKSTISAGGRVLDDHRSNLVRKTLNLLMCLRDQEVADHRK